MLDFRDVVSLAPAFYPPTTLESQHRQKGDGSPTLHDRTQRRGRGLRKTHNVYSQVVLVRVLHEEIVSFPPHLDVAMKVFHKGFSRGEAKSPRQRREPLDRQAGSGHQREREILQAGSRRQQGRESLPAHSRHRRVRGI